MSHTNTKRYLNKYQKKRDLSVIEKFTSAKVLYITIFLLFQEFQVFNKREHPCSLCEVSGNGADGGAFRLTASLLSQSVGRSNVLSPQEEALQKTSSDSLCPVPFFRFSLKGREFATFSPCFPPFFVGKEKPPHNGGIVRISRLSLHVKHF